MKVYVVWYVDSSPYMAFSAKEDAERFVEEQNSDWWAYQELEVDKVPEPYNG